MSTPEIIPAPQMKAPPSASKFAKERWAFFKMLSELLKEYDGEYVAIHEGRVVGHGQSQVEVALAAYDRFGYVPIYVGKVTSEPPVPARMPAPRLLRTRTDVDGALPVQHTG